MPLLRVDLQKVIVKTTEINIKFLKTLMFNFKILIRSCIIHQNFQGGVDFVPYQNNQPNQTKIVNSV